MEKSNFHLSSREGEVCRQQPGGGVFLFFGAVVLIFVASVASVSAREKNATHYGMGLIVNLPYPEAEVAQVVQEVVQNGIIRGTKEYNKDQYLGGAESASTTQAFQPWTEGGKVFYKVRLKALDPWNFKNTNDSGTVAVRYVVQGQDDKHTVLRIDARFVEDFRRVTHPSDGSVEGSEYKDIHDRLEAMALTKTQASEAEKSNESSSSKTQQIALKDEPATPAPASTPTPVSAANSTPAAPPAAPSTSEQTGLSSSPATPVNLEDRVRQLRQQVERLVKAPGAPLKSAPFHTASTVQSLASGTEVLIVISTPYWFGVETHDGQHGWILRDQLEPLP